MKKVIKFLLLFLAVIFFLNNTYVYADSLLGDSISSGKSFLQSASGTMSKEQEKSLKDTSNSIYNTLLMISFVVVAIVGIILGIKFMMAGVEEKADVKKSLIIFLIGTGVAYGAFGIWKVLVTFLNKV